MELKIKKLHEDAIVPTYGTPGAACFDLYAVDVCGRTVKEQAVLNKFNQSDQDFIAPEHGYPIVVRTGLAVEIPDGWMLQIYSRSGHGFRDNVRLANCVGIIDADYRGEILVKLTADSKSRVTVRNGDRIAQAMLVPVNRVSFQLVEELSNTARGAGGFGSTGA